MCVCQVVVLVYFVLCRFVGCCTSHGRVAALSTWQSACVWYCHVPRHGFTSGPRQDSGPIRPFVVITHQTDSIQYNIQYKKTYKAPYVTKKLFVSAGYSLTAAETWAFLIAFHMLSFKGLWRCCLGVLLRQKRSCSPSLAYTHFLTLCRTRTLFYRLYCEPLLLWQPHPRASVALRLSVVHATSRQHEQMIQSQSQLKTSLRAPV